MIKLFKRLRFFGALRSKILRFGHRVLLPCGGHSSQWDFVLDYLPFVYDKNRLKILEVGCTQTLFIYELEKLGYETWGVDIRPYQDKLPKNIKFIQGNLLNVDLPKNYFDYIVLVSVLQHIGTGQYGEDKYADGERKTIKKIATLLKPRGVLLLTTVKETIINKYALKGYNYFSIKDIFSGDFEIQEYTERHGHICVAMIKK